MTTSIRVNNAKDHETIGSDTPVQGEIPLFGIVRGPQAAAMDFIARASWDGVLRLCVQWSGKDDYEVADEICISHGTMSKVLKGTAGLWGARLVKFMRVTENLAPLQWLADQMGYDLVRRPLPDSEVERLKRERDEALRENAELKRRR